jgi:hypothetical protein
MIVRTLGRLLLVPIALTFGALTTAAVVVSLGQERLTHAMRGGAPDDAVFGLLGVMLKLGLVLANVQTLLVPFLVVVAGEVGRIRSAAYYVASFGAMAALIPLLGQIGATGAGGVPVWAIFASGGFAGGFVYWLLAGRSA